MSRIILYESPFRLKSVFVVCATLLQICQMALMPPQPVDLICYMLPVTKISTQFINLKVTLYYCQIIKFGQLTVGPRAF
jgi:hypothetical protein